MKGWLPQFHLFIAALLIFSHTAPALAVTDTDLGAMSVRAKETTGTYAKIPGTVNTISNEEIEELKPTDVTEVLRRVPGINYADEDGRGFKPNIGLRGLDPSRSRNVAILVDGLPLQPSVYGDPATYVNLPVEEIERIEVVKGPSSLLYHGNNLGGVINYITKRPPTDSKMQLVNSETFGEDSMFHSYTALGGTVDDISYRVSYLRKQGEGFRESDAYGVHDVSTFLEYRIDDQSEIISRSNWYYEDADTPGGLNRSLYDQSQLLSVTPDDQFEGRRVHTNLTYRNRFAENQSFETYFFYTFLRRDWFIASTVATGNTQFKRDFNVFGYGAKYELNYDVLGLEDNSFTLGVDFYHDKEDDTSVRGTTRTSRDGTFTANNDLGVFAVGVYGTTNLNVTERFRVAPVLRMDYVHNSLENNLTGVEGNDGTWAWSPGVGAEYDVLDNTTAYASFHRSFQAAEYKEAVSATTGAPNNLDAQRGTHFEVGLRTQPLSWLSAETALFTFDFDNEVISSGGMTINGQETRHSGIEGVLNLDLFGMVEDFRGEAFPEWLGSLDADFNLTLIDTDFRKGPNAGNELPQVPNWHFNWGLNYDHPTGFYANLYAQHVDEQYSNAGNTRNENAAATTGVIPSYKVWNLNFGYIWKKRYEAFFGVRNLFDEKYFTRRDGFFAGITPSPDRQVYFGFRIKVG